FLKIMPAKSSQPDPSQIKKKSTQPRPIKKGIVTRRAVLKTPTPVKKQNPTPTPKKAVVPKDESDDGVDEENQDNSEGEQDEEEGVSELEEVKKKQTKRSPATKKRAVGTVKTPKDEEIALGKGTDGGNLKAEGWTAVRRDMFKQFNINFDDDQVKNQKGSVRKLYIDMEFLLKLSGFGWCAATKMVTADEDTWDELIDAHPKRMFSTIRKGNNSWYELAQDLFEPSCATGATALLPGQAPPKSENKDTINVSSVVSGLSTNSIKRRKVVAKTIDVDSSGDEKVEDVKRAARDPPKKRIRENKYDILKNGVASIVDVLRGTPSQADIKTDTKPVVPPDAKPEPMLTTRQEAIKLMASMYFGKVPTMDYIRYIRVVESEVNAEVFISLASTTDTDVCTSWLNSVSPAI
ncbi:hypothetical protein MJO29_003755, partial [Puccinia striiformis f. sp. tritici]